MKVVAFNGSPHAQGNTAKLLGKVLEVLKTEGIKTELVQVGGRELHGCSACYLCKKQKDGRCGIDDDIANDCIEKMRTADGIIIGSPTYFADVTSETKALIDRAGLVARANGDMFKRKVGAAVIAARRGGQIHAFDTINHLFLIGQMIIPGSSYWNFGLGGSPGEVEKDEEGIKTMEDLGRNMAWLLKKLQG
ncbi:MAG: flavodoxin family protein [Pseudomonadota bacterium]